MKFHLEIDCDNAAFDAEPTKDVATVKDSNGNTVGRYWWSEDESEDA